jgi:hypothetical protein
MSDWNTQRVEQLASDSAALKAGQGLARPGKWRTIGRDDRLLWGECQGSGAKPYQVRVDLTDAANKCSCPSRKLPCKHALGLLLMLASGAAIPHAAPPDFASAWQAEREKRAADRAARQAAPEKPPDPKKQAKTAAKREARVEEGLDLLDAWLGDVLGQGLASMRAQPDTYWTQLAARLIDCQAPGLARRVRELGDTAVSSPDWQEQLVIGLGRLRLLVDACRRLADLPPGLAAEVRTQVGWTQPQNELLSRASVRGHWHVVATRQVQEEQLRVRHTWLLCDSQVALLVDFAAGRESLPAALPVGQCLDAELVHFDGVPALRALIKQVHARPGSLGTLAAPQDIASLQARYGELLAANPWLERWPAVLGPVTPRMRDERCHLVDAHGRMLLTPPRFQHGWHLLALSQGEPCQVFGEWNGQTFEPLSVTQHGQLYSLAHIDQLAVLSKVA